MSDRHGKPTCRSDPRPVAGVSVAPSGNESDNSSVVLLPKPVRVAPARAEPSAKPKRRHSSGSTLTPASPPVPSPQAVYAPPPVLRMAQFRNTFGEYDGYEFFQDGTEVPPDGVILRNGHRYHPMIVSGTQVGWKRMLS